MEDLGRVLDVVPDGGFAVRLTDHAEDDGTFAVLPFHEGGDVDAVCVGGGVVEIGGVGGELGVEGVLDVVRSLGGTSGADIADSVEAVA